MTFKLVDADNLLSLLRYMSIEGQGPVLTLAQVIYIWKIKLAFLRNHRVIFNQVLCVSF